MRNNPDFDAEKYAAELWAEIETIGYAQMQNEAYKTRHLKAFFKKKQLSEAQIKAVMKALQAQLTVKPDFDPLPYVTELYDLWTRKQFDLFYTVEENGGKMLNLTGYFNLKKIPLWQRDIINESFHAYMNVKAGENRKKVLIPMLICYGGAVVLAFLMPNLLQRFGLIAPNAGWGVKIVNGIGSFILLFLIARRVASYWLDKVLLGK